MNQQVQSPRLPQYRSSSDRDVEIIIVCSFVLYHNQDKHEKVENKNEGTWSSSLASQFPNQPTVMTSAPPRSSECVGLEWPLFRSNSEDFLGSNQGKNNKRGGGFHFHTERSCGGECSQLRYKVQVLIRRCCFLVLQVLWRPKFSGFVFIRRCLFSFLFLFLHHLIGGCKL